MPARRLGLLPLLLASCAHSPALESPSTPSSEPAARSGPRGSERAALPAGLCTGYLSHEPGCEDVVARFGVVIGPFRDAAAAERALSEARTLDLPGGYPFALTLDELPLKDSDERGILIVAGLFAELAPASALQRRLPSGTRAVELEQPEEAESVVVEITDRTGAYSQADLTALEERLDQELGRRWVPLPEQVERRRRALAELEPRCSLEPGRLFVSQSEALYAFSRVYAPARCPDGTAVFVPWRSTRLQSVVVATERGLIRHQVVLVECDQATVETRFLEAKQPARLALAGPC